jgi:hypothetical protein
VACQNDAPERHRHVKPLICLRSRCRGEARNSWLIPVVDAEKAYVPLGEDPVKDARDRRANTGIIADLRILTSDG